MSQEDSHLASTSFMLPGVRNGPLMGQALPPAWGVGVLVGGVLFMCFASGACCCTAAVVGFVVIVGRGTIKTVSNNELCYCVMFTCQEQVVLRYHATPTLQPPTQRGCSLGRDAAAVFVDHKYVAVALHHSSVGVAAGA